MEEIGHAEAPAKLNLMLRVTGRRADGYHVLHMLNVALDLCDSVTVSRAAANKISVECSPLVAKKLNNEDLAALNNPELNSAARAAAEFGKATALAGAIDIRITKRIPLQSGLGGGSSDAAAVLAVLGNHFLRSASTRERDEILLHAARAVGADVPYFLRGGCAEVFGIGESVTPIAPNLFTGMEILLIVPPFGCSTAAVYAHFRAANPKLGESLDKRAEINKKGEPLDLLRALVQNDLEGAAVAEQPQLQEILDAVRETPDTIAGLTGSGSVIFATFCGASSAREKNFAALHKVSTRFACELLRQKIV